MALNRRKPENTPEREDSYNWENLEGDRDYDARLIGVFDLGLQEKTYKGDYQGDFQQITLGFEILEEGMEDEESGEWLPRILFTKPFYIYSTMDAKSKEYEFYKIFDKKAKADSEPDWEGQLGKPCSVYVINIEDGDKMYDNIESISAIQPKYWDDIPEATVEEFVTTDADDEDDPGHELLRGLAKYCFEHRVGAPEKKPEKKAKTRSSSKGENTKGGKKTSQKPTQTRTRKPAKEVEEEEEVEEEPTRGRSGGRTSSNTSSRSTSKTSGNKSGSKSGTKTRSGTRRPKVEKDDDPDEDIPF